MKLLVAIDLSESTETIARQAERLGKALAAKLWLIHIAAPNPDFIGLAVGPQTVRDSISHEFHGEHRQLQTLASRLRAAGIDATALLVQGATVETILKEASKIDVDIIVVGSHGRGAMHQLLLGSVSEGIVHGSDRPVLVVPTHER